MEFFAVIIGIGIGYALYRKNRANREEDYDDDYEEEARFEPREPVYPTRNHYRILRRLPLYRIRHDPRNTDPNAAIREIDEAIRAGERALDSLREAKNQLNSARNWGIYDMIGGGLISSMIKHSKIDQANEWMDQANRDLRCFAKELRDVDGEDLQIDTGSLVTMLDIFCDNFFSDLLVQQKINDGRARIDALSDRIEDVLYTLKQRANGIARQYQMQN